MNKAQGTKRQLRPVLTATARVTRGEGIWRVVGATAKGNCYSYTTEAPVIIIIIIFLHGFSRLTYSCIDAL
jgi:hypothetical protein